MMSDIFDETRVYRSAVVHRGNLCLDGGIFLTKPTCKSLKLCKKENSTILLKLQKMAMLR